LDDGDQPHAFEHVRPGYAALEVLSSTVAAPAGLCLCLCVLDRRCTCDGENVRGEAAGWPNHVPLTTSTAPPPVRLEIGNSRITWWWPSSGVTREDIHGPTEKQSQSCCLKKSGLRVWTSGRFVNMLGEKDILVCVHTGNILWAWGRFWYVKVPSSPYKMGREGTCKRIQTFGNLCNLRRELQSLCALTLCLNVLKTLSLVLGESSEFFG
jgi:hypothetical protein